jgi:glycosyltransferase involved in cell wall biosynthesis
MEPSSSPSRRHLAFLVSGFSTGGVPRIMSQLAGAFADRGHRVDLVAVSVKGPTSRAVPGNVRLIDLDDWWVRPIPRFRRRSVRAVLSSAALARYLRSEGPEVLLSGGNYPNFAAVAGRWLGRSSTRVVLSHHSDLSREAGKKPFVRWTVRHLYPRCDRVVTVSQGVADELVDKGGVPASRITTIYNPVVSPEIRSRLGEEVDHPWLQPGQPPVVLGIGRLHAQKDFPTLLRAFARIREQREAKLLILGVGKHERHRNALLALGADLGIEQDMDLPGFLPHPFAIMARASVFVLSSAWEGLPTALIEAMACGCPVASTNCASGPAEILDQGKYGPLVPVGDDAALARAALELIANPPERSLLQARAEMFSVDSSVDRYSEVLLP